MSEPKLGFEMRRIQLPLDSIFPVRQIKDPERTITRFPAILASIKEVGLIEPLVVYPQKDAPGKYSLLDGHLRRDVLLKLGHKTADCIIATDDECFTYNARVSRVPPIQEHKMIKKAIQNGVKPERIAAALDIPVKQVLDSLNLLDGINQEAAELLKEKDICPAAIRFLKKVAGMRQIEIAELMVGAANYTAGYAEALYLGTPKAQLANPEKPKTKEGLSPKDIARMEQEMESLEHDFKAIDESYGENVLNLTVVRGYTKKLIENTRVAKFLRGNYPDLLSEFESIAAAETL